MTPEHALRQQRLQQLSRQALEQLQRGRADRAAPLVEQMAPLLADRPQLLRQMRQVVAVTGFRWPARREPAAPAAAAPLAPDRLDLVAFHADLDRVPSGVHPGIDYGAVLAQSFESARLRAPAARRILLTDEATRLPELPGVEVLRRPLDRGMLMYERMRLQAEWLATRPAGRATVFVDSDVVVNLDPAAVFAEDFDVGLTYRAGAPEAPFNGGILFVAAGERGAAFFRSALECYRALAADSRIAALYDGDLRAWWGDQFALAALVGHRAFAERNAEALRVDGAKARFFPCDTHNFTLEARPYAPQELAGRYFIHFKGGRKAMQAAYVQAMREGRL